MTFTVSQTRAVAKALAAGGYVLSDNDGTLAPFTPSPDQTVIPEKTLDAITQLQRTLGPERFMIVTGRDVPGIQGVLERSQKGASASIPVLADDGAVYIYGAQTHNSTTPAEQAFMESAQTQVRDYLEARTRAEPAMYGFVILELKKNGININTNAIYNVRGAAAAQELNKEFATLFGALCEKSPEHDGTPGYAMHVPPGSGVEIRSTRISKREGVENLMKLGIVGKPLVLLVDDIKRGGNDVAVARLVKENGGIVIQVRRENPAQAYPDSKREVEPDIALDSPAEVAVFLRSVLKEHALLKKPAAPQPKR